VMVVDSGARGHVISKAYENNWDVDKIIVVGGNDFVGFERDKEVVVDRNCSMKDSNSILDLAIKYKPDLVDVAQDDALAVGAVDLLLENGFEVFGPTKDAARLEWDKAFARELMKEHSIPHPDFTVFTDVGKAYEHTINLYNENPDSLVYVKAAGLCAGKGALAARNLMEAHNAIDAMSGFKEAGKTFLIEEGMEGEEYSAYVVTDGVNYYKFKTAQDNKRAFNNDEGLQTGGMGAVAPSVVGEREIDVMDDLIIRPTIRALQERGTPYKGILYVGGMDTLKGTKVVEFNSRWGDPEVQAVLPLLKTDYLDLVQGVVTGNLNNVKFDQSHDNVRVCVVGASRGYPGDYSNVKGKRIFGLEEAMMFGVDVYGAGIKMEDGKFYADGGRLFSVVGEGDDIIEARCNAYAAMSMIHIDGNRLHYRTDIGWRDAERLYRQLTSTS